MTLHNEILAVAIDENNLGIDVCDRRGDVHWRTPGNGLDLQVYDIGLQDYRWYTSAGGDSASGAAGRNPQSRCSLALEQLSETDAVASVDFLGIELSFAVRFSLKGAKLVVEIPQESWDFAGEKANEVISVDCFPQFGGKPRGSEGYLVLPHFGGCLRHFVDRPDRPASMAQALKNEPSSPYAFKRSRNASDPHAPQTYSAMTYGYQPNWRDLIAYPLWGAAAGESGWAAYVPFGFGDADTAIVTNANQGEDEWCAAHCRFYYREHAHDRRVDEERKLVFTFLHEKRLNYSSIGRVYRRYLLEEASVPSLREKCRTSPETEYLTGAFYLRSCLALKRYSYINNPNPDGKGILDVYMTCDELAGESRRWKEAGVDKALIQIVGANSEGHDGNYPTYFPLEPQVGGEEGFKRLLATIKELGYRSSVHVNIRCYMRASPDFRIDAMLRDRDGGSVFSNSGPGGDDYNACPEAVWRTFVQRNFARLKGLGLDGGLYTDFLIGVLFRCYHPLHPLTRRGYLEAVRAYLQTARETFGAVRVEAVIAPVLNEVDAVARILAADAGEGFLQGAELTQKGLVDEVVPLQAVIFHGLIVYGLANLCVGEKDCWGQVLTLAAIGAKPLEELRGPQPQWDDLHVLTYRIFCEQMRWLQFEWIENIEKLGEATRTVYSDGTVVWVNHGTTPIDTDGQNLPGRSFWIKPGTLEHEELFIEEDRSLLNCEPAVCPDGSKWPDGRPREGVVMERARPNEGLGMMIGKDFT